jgi:hypothetical protein
MKTIETVEPKDIWKFFKDLSPGRGVFLAAKGAGLSLVETDDASEPPNPTSSDLVTRADWMAFLRVVVALRGKRPVKVSPVPDDPNMLRLFVGPKP